MKRLQRRLLSQNFLQSSRLIFNLLERTSIGKNDIVLEIGAGRGIITQELAKKAGAVIAIELDSNLYEQLNNKFLYRRNVSLINTDFRTYLLPTFPYKVFSNIPFIITSDIIKKLTFSSNPPLDSYLVVQMDAAKKFIGKPLGTKESQVSILLKPFFETSVLHNFSKFNFSPAPSVKTVLLRIKKRDTPLIPLEGKKDFENFVVYVFNQTNPSVHKTLQQLNVQADIPLHLKPTELSLNQWIILFNKFQGDANEATKVRIKSFVRKYNLSQSKIQKINRTRKDKYWRKY